MATASESVVSLQDTTCCPVCHSTLSRPKLLSCLHAVCQACLARCTRPDGSLVCPHDGCSRVTDGSLVLCGLSDHHPLRRLILSRSADTARRCEECLEEDAEEATATCEDCAVLLCDFHATSHKRSRATAKHRLKEGKEAVSHPPTATKCSFHPANDLNKFCSDCKRVLCEHCAGLAAHAGHTVTSVSSAIDGQTSEMKRLSEHVEQTVAPELKRRLSAVQASKEKVNARVEEMSATVTRSVQKVIDKIKEEEGKLLEDIDKARWAELIELEKTEIALKDLIAVSERAVGLTSASATRSLSDMELLQVASSAAPRLAEMTGEAEKPFEAKEWKMQVIGSDRFQRSHIELLEKESVAQCVQETDPTANLIVPQQADLGQPLRISFTSEHLGNVCSVITPSGKVQKLECEATQTMRGAVTATCLFTPAEMGKHSIEVWSTVSSRLEKIASKTITVGKCHVRA